MKKAKIMLSALAVVAVVGGALAFKAKTFGTSYCIAPSGNTVCSTFEQSYQAGGAVTYNYTLNSNPVACTEHLVTCPSNGKITVQP